MTLLRQLMMITARVLTLCVTRAVITLSSTDSGATVARGGSLQVDCEGCEHELIPSLGPTLLTRTLVYEGEVHRCTQGMACRFSRAQTGATLKLLCPSFPTRNASFTLNELAAHTSVLTCNGFKHVDSRLTNLSRSS